MGDGAQPPAHLPLELLPMLWPCELKRVKNVNAWITRPFANEIQIQFRFRLIYIYKLFCCLHFLPLSLSLCFVFWGNVLNLICFTLFSLIGERQSQNQCNQNERSQNEDWVVSLYFFVADWATFPHLTRPRKWLTCNKKEEKERRERRAIISKVENSI